MCKYKQYDRYVQMCKYELLAYHNTLAECSFGNYNILDSHTYHDMSDTNNTNERTVDGCTEERMYGMIVLCVLCDKSFLPFDFFYHRFHNNHRISFLYYFHSYHILDKLRHISCAIF